jgi:hypothetical protein
MRIEDRMKTTRENHRIVRDELLAVLHSRVRYQKTEWKQHRHRFQTGSAVGRDIVSLFFTLGRSCILEYQS